MTEEPSAESIRALTRPTCAHAAPQFTDWEQRAEKWTDDRHSWRQPAAASGQTTGSLPGNWILLVFAT